MLNIFVNTWGNYNENGADGGEWITLPIDPDELQNKLQAIATAMNDNDPEFFINDYEFTCEIEFGDVGEMDSITEWNDLCNDVEGLKEYELEEIAAAMEAFGYNFAEAMERQQNGELIFYSGMDLEEVAEELIDECYDLPEFALRYFDYKAFARDLEFDGYTETKYGVILEG